MRKGDRGRGRERDINVAGINTLFVGSLLSFLVDGKPAFEIPLSEVSRVSSGKHEVALEFHQGETAPVSLVEMRFHIPSTGVDGEDDPVQVRENCYCLCIILFNRW